MRIKGRENFLDYIPVKNPEFLWEFNKKGHVEIAMKNKGFFNRIAQLFFQRPGVSFIELDDMGTFIWRQIDGKKDVYEISEEVKKKFGENAKPLYTRLCQYVKILRNYKLIQLLRGKT